MIFALVLFILVFVFFAFFIGKNLSNVCNFWFFKSFEQLPVAVLVIIAFAMGIAFAVLIFAIFKIKQSTAVDAETAKALKSAKQERAMEKANRRKERLEEKTKALKESRKSEESAGSGPVVPVIEGKGSSLGGIFGKHKDKKTADMKDSADKK